MVHLPAVTVAMRLLTPRQTQAVRNGTRARLSARIIGALTNEFGARAGMTICGAVPALAAVVMAGTTHTWSRRGVTNPGRVLSSIAGRR
ncbi:MAG: hypothetical protein JO345_36905 [Streptosporangiaceae bacterium]|nr:hypothetical protein [Streptosporangiaceae bacterium]